MIVPLHAGHAVANLEGTCETTKNRYADSEELCHSNCWALLISLIAFGVRGKFCIDIMRHLECAFPLSVLLIVKLYSRSRFERDESML